MSPTLLASDLHGAGLPVLKHYSRAPPPWGCATITTPQRASPTLLASVLRGMGPDFLSSDTSWDRYCAAASPPADQKAKENTRTSHNCHSEVSWLRLWTWHAAGAVLYWEASPPEQHRQCQVNSEAHMVATVLSAFTHMTPCSSSALADTGHP
jgi:hypothetical protein